MPEVKRERGYYVVRYCGIELTCDGNEIDETIEEIKELAATMAS